MTSRDGEPSDIETAEEFADAVTRIVRGYEGHYELIVAIRDRDADVRAEAIGGAARRLLDEQGAKHDARAALSESRAAEARLREALERLLTLYQYHAIACRTSEAAAAFVGASEALEGKH